MYVNMYLTSLTICLDMFNYLQVNEDSYEENETKTVFRNTMTDEISISKLNPNVTDFVPSSVRQSRPQYKQGTPKKVN